MSIGRVKKVVIQVDETDGHVTITTYADGIQHNSVTHTIKREDALIITLREVRELFPEAEVELV